MAPLLNLEKVEGAGAADVQDFISPVLTAAHSSNIRVSIPIRLGTGDTIATTTCSFNIWLTRSPTLKLEYARLCLMALHQTSAVQIAMQAVLDIVAKAKDDTVRLAGHSLGAAMAMLLGKNLAKTGTFLESYLFNPLFFSAPIERIQNPNVKHGIRFPGSLLTAGLAVALRNKQQMTRSSEDPFAGLADWVPYLYVHPDNHTCFEYIGYFEHRSKTEEFGDGAIERLATQHSLGGLVLSAMGR